MGSATDLGERLRAAVERCTKLREELLQARNELVQLRRELREERELAQKRLAAATNKRCIKPTSGATR